MATSNIILSVRLLCAANEIIVGNSVKKQSKTLTVLMLNSSGGKYHGNVVPKYNEQNH